MLEVWILEFPGVPERSEAIPSLTYVPRNCPYDGRQRCLPPLLA
jgi:hypothetical protein